MTDTASTGATPDREALRAELEATRAAYHDLLKSLSAEDWKKKTGNAAWTVRQLMWHVAWGAGYLPRAVDNCRTGRRGRLPPLFNQLNILMTRLGSARATPESLARKFDESHEAVVAALNGVRDDEWQKGTQNYLGYTTVEDCFRNVIAHFREHAADIRKGLGR